MIKSIKCQSLDSKCLVYQVPIFVPCSTDQTEFDMSQLGEGDMEAHMACMQQCIQDLCCRSCGVRDGQCVTSVIRTYVLDFTKQVTFKVNGKSWLAFFWKNLPKLWMGALFPPKNFFPEILN